MLARYPLIFTEPSLTDPERAGLLAFIRDHVIDLGLASHSPDMDVEPSEGNDTELLPRTASDRTEPVMTSSGQAVSEDTLGYLALDSETSD
jgi:hypothetical protein